VGQRRFQSGLDFYNSWMTDEHLLWRARLVRGERPISRAAFGRLPPVGSAEVHAKSTPICSGRRCSARGGKNDSDPAFSDYGGERVRVQTHFGQRGADGSQLPLLVHRTGPSSDIQLRNSPTTCS